MSKCIGYTISYQMPGSPGIIKENVYTVDFTAAKRSVEGKGGRVLNYGPIFT